MIDKIIDAVNKFDLLNDANAITVALSGGADSISLLVALNSLKECYGYNLYAAHFNHGIRGEEADRDENFVKDFCKKIGVTLFCEKGDVPSFAKDNNLSIETAARELRYEFLYRVSVGKIATAHTASDNLETVLFNMVRGASLNGVKGIPVTRDRIIRPLILCTRADIEAYCKENGLSFVTDSTNNEDDCSRNIIRHKIVPVLSEINSRATENVSKLSVILCEDSDCLNEIANNEYEMRINEKCLDIKGFENLHKSIAKRLIIKCFETTFCKTPDYIHIENIYNVCIGKSKKTGLFEDNFAFLRNNRLVLGKENKTDAEFCVTVEKISADDFNNGLKIHELFLNCCADYDKIVGELKRSEKQNSDTMRRCNSNSTKTLKKLFTEKNIPLNLRKNIPVFKDDNGIVWVYKLGCADRVKVDSDTKNVIYFNCKVLGENKK